MTNYNFETVLSRKDTACEKWDGLQENFGCTDILPMWVADMDFAAPPEVVAVLKEKAAHGVFGYPLREDSYYEAIVSWLQKRYAWQVQPQWLLNTPGVVAALSTAVQTFTEPGDKVIVQTPVYPPFFRSVIRNDRQVALNPLVEQDGYYTINFTELEKLTADPAAKLLLFCSPHNPVGRVWSQAELQQVSEICQKNNVLLVSDEIHGDLLLDGRRHKPVATLSEGALAQTITCLAPSKTFNLAGLYSSVVVIPNPKMRQQFTKTVEANAMGGGNVFGIAALEAAYSTGEPWLEALLAYLTANADYLVKYLQAEAPAIKVRKPEGTYLAWLDCRELKLSQDELQKFFACQAKVGLNNGTNFGVPGEGFMRLNFGCPRATLQQGLSGISKALKNR